MTPHKGHDAARLHAALQQSDPLTHAEAETLIALLVEAEAMDDDVDDDPTFAPLFVHLDHCTQCLALYEALSEDYAASLTEQTRRPSESVPFPAHVTPQTRPTFEFVVHAPRSSNTFAVRESPASYGSAEQIEQFADTEWLIDDQGATLSLRVLPPHNALFWRIEAHADHYTVSAHTNQQGVATFYGVPTDAAITLLVHEAG